MSQIKTVRKFFSIFQWEKEQEFLQEQHRQGWKLVNVRSLGRYQFEACPPEDVVYQLDYNPSAGKDDYLQLFRDCGWEYLQDYFGYSYFRKPAARMHGKEEIFCDDISRLELIKRIYRGRMLPLLLIFCSALIPFLVLQIKNGNVFLGVLYGLIVALYLYCFILFGVEYHKFRKKLNL